MNMETTIAKNIRIADDKAKYDAACKRLLSENSGGEMPDIRRRFSDRNDAGIRK